jgi:hypothetical protein
MNARRIIDLFRRACLEHVKPPLGRWNIHNYSQTSLKIKYANEDNCGISSYYNKKQFNNQSEYTNKDKDTAQDKDIDYLYVYMMGCETVPDNAYINR